VTDPGTTGIPPRDLLERTYHLLMSEIQKGRVRRDDFNAMRRTAQACAVRARQALSEHGAKMPPWRNQ
jgi:hypothetical protein